MYLVKFEKYDSTDNVEEWLYNTSDYWRIFKTFEDFLKTFCLYEAVCETSKQEPYKKFYKKGWFDKSKGVELFLEYNKALNILIDKRKKELNERVNSLINA